MANHSAPLNQGDWTVGRSGTVVSSAPIEGGEGTGHADVEYYGGHLICESIRNAADAQLLAAAPKLLAAVQQGFGDNSLATTLRMLADDTECESGAKTVFSDWLRTKADEIEAAIAQATGRS